MKHTKTFLCCAVLVASLAGLLGGCASVSQEEFDEIADAYSDLEDDYEDATSDLAEAEDSLDQLTDDHEALTTDYASLQSELETLQSEYESLQAQLDDEEEAASVQEEELSYSVVGDFGCSVWEILDIHSQIPTGYTGVVVSAFQSSPTIVYVEDSLAASIAPGDQLICSIDPTSMGYITASEFEEDYAGDVPSLSEVSGKRFLLVHTITEPTEDQLGLGAPYLTYALDE